MATDDPAVGSASRLEHVADALGRALDAVRFTVSEVVYRVEVLGEIVAKVGALLVAAAITILAGKGLAWVAPRLVEAAPRIAREYGTQFLEASLVGKAGMAGGLGGVLVFVGAIMLLGGIDRREKR